MIAMPDEQTECLMASIEDLIATMEVEREAAEMRERKASAEIKLTLDTATKEGRSNLTEEEDTLVTEAFARRDAAKADIDGVNHKLAKAQRVKDEERESAQRAASGSRPGALPASGGTRQHEGRFTSSGRDERTYSKGTDPRGTGFLRDVCRQFMYRDPAAEQRLSAHMHEERIERAEYLERAAGDTTTANWAGLTVPQYLTDMYAPAIAGLRPFADICNKHPLPESGMSVNISQVTTPSSAGLQASELAAVAGVTIDDTLLTIPVQTAAGQQTLSRQAIDRGTGIEDVVMQDLYSRYATALDSTLITQGVTGLSAVSVATAYTTASPTGVGMYPKFMAAAAGVEAALLAMGQPTHTVMHSRRWYWLASQLTTAWPLINTGGSGLPFQVGAVDQGSSYDSGVRGVLPNGLSVVVDNNISTALGAGTEDEAYVVPSRECHLWEDANAPLYIRADQPKAANLGVLLVLYGYFAYTFSRYANAMQKVNGTGFIAPTF